jgi:hypothetical protein
MTITDTLGKLTTKEESMFAGLTGWHLIILTLLGLPQLILWIVALVGIIGSRGDSGTIALWFILITLIPIIGSILWFVVGKRTVAQRPQPELVTTGGAPAASGGSVPTAGAGWYPSPEHPGLRQWWDGSEWTNHLES